MIPETIQQFDRLAWFLLILVCLPLAGYLAYLLICLYYSRKGR